MQRIIEVLEELGLPDSFGFFRGVRKRVDELLVSVAADHD